MTLKTKLGKILSSSAKLSGTSSSIFEEKEKFLRPILTTIVGSLRDNVLTDVPVEPVVAGGFLRDHLVGVTPKDLDIFIKFSPDLDEFDRDYFKGLIFGRLKEMDEINEEEAEPPPFFEVEDLSKNYDNNSAVVQILDGVLEFGTTLKFENYRPPSIQLIAHTQEVDELLDRFDINLCKVAYVPDKDEFIYTPQFLDDFNNKKVTLDPRHAQNLSSRARHERIGRKMLRAWTPTPPGKVINSMWSTIDTWTNKQQVEQWRHQELEAARALLERQPALQINRIPPFIDPNNPLRIERL